MSTGRLDGEKHKYLISHAVNILRILGFPVIIPYFRLGSREIDVFACRSYGKPVFIECIVSEKPKQVIQKIRQLRTKYPYVKFVVLRFWTPYYPLELNGENVQLIETPKPPKEYIDDYLEVFGVS